MTREERNKYNYNLIHRINADGQIEKKCSNIKCHEWKVMDEEFYPWEYSKMDGYSSQCKECLKNAVNKRNADNPEAHRKATQKWYAENSEYKKEYVSNWQEENRDHRRDYLSNYYEENKDRFPQYRLFRELHKHHDINTPEWESCKMYFCHRCACCGKKIEEHWNFRKGKMKLFDFCRDHFENNGSNDLTNCIPLCTKCNNKKNTKNFYDFYNEKNKDFTYERLDKIHKWIFEDCFQYVIEKKPRKPYTRKNKMI